MARAFCFCKFHCTHTPFVVPCGVELVTKIIEMDKPNGPQRFKQCSIPAAIFCQSFQKEAA
eukprot:708889-Amphidinium_carterae.1